MEACCAWSSRLEDWPAWTSSGIQPLMYRKVIGRGPTLDRFLHRSPGPAKDILMSGWLLLPLSRVLACFIRALNPGCLALPRDFFSLLFDWQLSFLPSQKQALPLVFGSEVNPTTALFCFCFFRQFLFSSGFLDLYRPFWLWTLFPSQILVL